MIGAPPLVGGAFRVKRTEVGPGETDRYWGGPGWAVGREAGQRREETVKEGTTNIRKLSNVCQTHDYAVSKD